MSNKLEIDTSDIIFIMDTLKVLGQTLDVFKDSDVNDLLIESEGILNRAMAITYKDEEMLRDTRYVLAE